MSEIKIQDDVTTWVRGSRNLHEKGKEEVAGALLVGVSKVELKVGHRRISGFAHRFNILDDRGTGRIHQSPLRGTIKTHKPKDAFA